MNPDEEAVLEAAKAYYHDCDNTDLRNELMDAVRTLEERESTFADLLERENA